MMRNNGRIIGAIAGLLLVVALLGGIMAGGPSKLIDRIRPTTTTTLSAPTGPAFDFMVSVQGVRNAWIAPYFRTLPYSANVGWVDGDRQAYRCGYAFLQQAGNNVGRVTFTRIHEAASYSALNDRQMEEGVRHYDGTLDTEDQAQFDECPEPSESYAPGTVSERPVITYKTPGGVLLEVRDYNKIKVADERLTFESVLVSDSRVTVVASFDHVPFFVIYYDAMGTTVMSSDR